MILVGIYILDALHAFSPSILRTVQSIACVSIPDVVDYLPPVLSCPVLSCPVLSCPVLSYPILSYPFLSCPVLSCPVLSYPVLSCHVLSCPVLSCPVLVYFTLSPSPIHPSVRLFVILPLRSNLNADSLLNLSTGMTDHLWCSCVVICAW